MQINAHNLETMKGSVKIKEARHVRNPHNEPYTRNKSFVSHRRNGSNYVNNADVIHVLVDEGIKSKRSKKSVSKKYS